MCVVSINMSIRSGGAGGGPVALTARSERHLIGPGVRKFAGRYSRIVYIVRWWWVDPISINVHILYFGFDRVECVHSFQSQLFNDTDLVLCCGHEISCNSIYKSTI